MEAKRNFFFAAIFIVTSLIGHSTSFKVIDPRKKHSMPDCSNEQCLSTVKNMEASMDSTIDPCDDFYGYVCGNWAKLSRAVNQGEKATMSHFHVRSVLDFMNMLSTLRSDLNWTWPLQQAKIFLKSCQNERALNDKGLSPLRSLLRLLKLPEIPIAFFDSGPEPRNVIKQLARLKKNLGIALFFQILAHVNPRNNKEYLLQFALPRREITLNKKLKNSQVEKDISNIDRIDSIKEVISVLIADLTGRHSFKSAISEDRLDKIATTIFNLTEELYSIDSGPEYSPLELVQVTDDNYMTLEQLQSFTDIYVKSQGYKPKVIWKPYLEELLGDGKKFNADSEVLIFHKDYLKRIALFLAKTPSKHLELLLWWKTVDFSAPFLSEKLRTLRIDNKDSLAFIQVTCLATIWNFFGFALTRSFADRSSSRDGGKANVEIMLKNIQISLSKSINESDWIDKATKNKILQKNTNMVPLIGYPEWIFDDKQLNKYYEGINMSEDGLLANLENLMTQSVKRSLWFMFEDRINEPQWIVSPTSVNAFYYLNRNALLIPYGIMHHPFYNLGLDVWNYAAMGSMLGHEIVHAFDNLGRQFDMRGNFRDWWSNKTISKFAERSQCFVDQYNGSHPELPQGLYVDGVKTMNENIADYEGLKHAYGAYQLWKSKHDTDRNLYNSSTFNRNQLFFLGYAYMWCGVYRGEDLKEILKDDHAPSFIRVNNVLRNSGDFSKVWNCKSGSRMNPAKKCKIW